MFGVYFGTYLVNKGIITKNQLNNIIEDSQNTRVKMGFLAVEAGYMTEAQSDEVNMLQQMQDKRFGDIAVEKGYLTDEQVGDLLARQGDDYLVFVQTMVDRKLMSLDAIQSELNAYKREGHFTAKDIDALKSGDIDRIVPVFVKDETIPDMIKDYISLTARNMVRFIDRSFRMETVKALNTCDTPVISAQELDGDGYVFSSFSGEGLGIKMLAEAFAKEEFEQVDLDVLDAACEFLNCNNGLFATNACNNGIEIDMKPPVMKDAATTIKSSGNLYKMTLYIKGEPVDLVLSLDGPVVLN